MRNRRGQSPCTDPREVPAIGDVSVDDGRKLVVATDQFSNVADRMKRPTSILVGFGSDSAQPRAQALGYHVTLELAA